MGEAAAWPLGVRSHQQGEHDWGAEMIDRAIALNPSVAAYHANMAEVYRTLGRLDGVEDCCRTALHLQPDYPEAANSLGLILLARDRPARPSPSLVWHFSSGPVLLWPAITWATPFVVRRQTAGSRTSDWLGLEARSRSSSQQSGARCIWSRNEMAQAFRHCCHAVRLRPDCAEAHNNLGNVPAVACYEIALRLDNTGHAGSCQWTWLDTARTGALQMERVAYSKKRSDSTLISQAAHCNLGTLQETGDGASDLHLRDYRDRVRL